MIRIDKIKDILKELPILEVADKLGIEHKGKSAKCFIHDDHNPSLGFNISKNTWKCYVCNKGGDQVTLVMDYNQMSYTDACKWLADHFNILIPEDDGCRKFIIRGVKKTITTRYASESKIVDMEVCNWLIDNARLSDNAKKFLYDERFFCEEVVRKMKVKSVSDSKRAVNALVSEFGEERSLESGLVRRGDYGLYFYFHTPCLLFPYYEQDGKLVGIQSRYLGTQDKVPRFQFLASQKTRLFNLPILNSLKQGDKLYISEGITDCLAMLSAGLNAVAIPSATILPKEDLVLLKNYYLHMFPDQDDAGQRAFLELRSFFVNHYSTIKAEKLPDFAKDYCDFYISTKLKNEKQ